MKKKIISGMMLIFILLSFGGCYFAVGEHDWDRDHHDHDGYYHGSTGNYHGSGGYYRGRDNYRGEWHDWR